MKRFELVRSVDATGVSGTGIVAEGVMFTDGICALRWKTRYTSTAVYACMEELVRIHGHGGQTVISWIDEDVIDFANKTPFDCGRIDAVQDSMENCPFASVGGLDSKENMKLPECVDLSDRVEYLRGYQYQAFKTYGEDWRTCLFEWKQSLTI